jgi:hypothetical protein
MFFLSKDTVKDGILQEPRILASWDQEVVPTLPKNLEEQAWRLGAMVRKGGKVQSASDLLRGILAYVLTAHSFRGLGVWGVVAGIADMAGTSWRERLQKAGDWLYWLLNELLKPERQEPHPLLQKAGYERIELVDASNLKEQGEEGKLWRIHCMYSLCTQRFHQIQITSAKVAEGIGNFVIEKGVVYVHDSAYGYRGGIAATEDAGAYSVSGFYPTTFPVEDVEGKAIDVVKWLKNFHAKARAIRSISAFYWYNEKRYAVRLIALKRTPEQAKEQVSKKKKRIGGGGKKKIQKESLYLSTWLLVLTTLPERDWTCQEVLSLYRARWQIEMIFKRIKQLLAVHSLRVKTALSVKTTIAAIVVSWVLQQEVAVEIRSLLGEMYRQLDSQKAGEEEEEVLRIVSEWRVQKLSSDLFRQQVQGPLTKQRILECFPKLERHFRDSPRKRTHQWQRVTQWLITPEKASVSLKGGKSRKTGSALTAALA